MDERVRTRPEQGGARPGRELAPTGGIALTRSRRRSVLRPEHPILAAAVLVIAYLALVPLAYLLWRTFVDDGEPTLRFFREAYSTYELGSMLRNSLWFALGSTLVAVSLGTVLAYLVVRTDVPWKPLLFAAALVPLVIPGILYSIAWIWLASPRSGALNSFLEPVFGPETIDIFNLWGMIAVEGLHLAPLVFLLMAAAFRSLDPALEESARASGAGIATTFRRVTLPLVWPALSASILIISVRALEAFEVPALIGLPDGTWVFTSRIWRSLSEYPPNFGQAGAYSFTLLALTGVGVLLHFRFSRRSRSYETVTGRGFRPGLMPLGRWRWPLTGAVALYLVIAALLPMLVLLYVSTQRFYSAPSLDGLSAMTLDQYAATLDDEQTLRAFKNSLILGVGSATAVVICMALAAWIVVRTNIRGRWLIDALAFLPIAVPGLVLGVALLFVYLRLPIPVYGTLWILFIAYFTRYMPYGMRTASISMIQIGRELEESAQASGASWLQTFRRVIVPLLLPGLLAGWIYILIVSLRELSSSILLYSPGDEVLAIAIFEQYQNGSFPELAALGVLMVVVIGALTVLAYRLGARVGVRET
jgi:iron(III) transport system permease protein